MLDLGSLLGALVIWAGVLVYASFNDPQTVDGSFGATAATPAANANANALTQ